MSVEFTQAKNGEKTVKVNSLFIHSAYAPSTEAKRVIDSLSIPYSPSCIVLVEPGLNYLHSFLREKFAEIKIGVIRYSSDFSEYNKEYDFVINAFKNDVEQELFQNLSEEELCSTYFLPWNPSAKAYSEIDSKTWPQIKQTLEKAKTILVSREYFEKKWLLNCCKNLINVKKSFVLKKKFDLPVFITASGPSLESKIDFIKQNQNKAFIICLSSAISVLLQNDIIPDLCFTTDGGFWAGEHLKQLNKHHLNIALASEAFCPAKLYSNSNIVLLNYPEGISSELCNEFSYSTMNGKRNGTVSGTALDFCLDYSTDDIYFFGLDLSAGKGFQHTNPNELEMNNSLSDNRIKSVEKRMTGSICRSDSLKIYEDWFASKKLNGRKVFRVIENNEKNNDLNQIKDISLAEVEKKFTSIKTADFDFTDYFEAHDNSADTKKLFKSVKEKLSKTEYKKLLFPLDYVALSHNASAAITERIEEKSKKLEDKLEKLFNGN